MTTSLRSPVRGEVGDRADRDLVLRDLLLPSPLVSVLVVTETTDADAGAAGTRQLSRTSSTLRPRDVTRASTWNAAASCELHSSRAILDEHPAWNRRVGVGSEHKPQGGNMYIGVGALIIIILLLVIFVF
jgi:hypothetical protein